LLFADLGFLLSNAPASATGWFLARGGAHDGTTNGKKRSMDLTYVAILILFFILIGALALGCGRLQRRHGGAPAARQASPANEVAS